MRKKIEWQWELIEESPSRNMQTLRAKVIGGWVLKTIVAELKLKLLTSSMVFIADRDHEWHIIPPVVQEAPKKIAEADAFEPRN
jgi:hypothetical protein